MKIRNYDGEKWLSVCAWKKADICTDKYINVDEARALLEIPVDRVSHGICRACEAVLAHQQGDRLTDVQDYLCQMENAQDAETVDKLAGMIRLAITELLHAGKMQEEEYNDYLLTILQAGINKKRTL